MPDLNSGSRDEIAVLIVDDSPEDVMLVRRLLSGDPTARYRTEAAETGSEAVERCAAGAPDCLLLDYHLPDMDGLDVMRALEDRLGSIPIVMLTGAGDGGVGVEAVRLGAQDYLDKSALETTRLSRSVRYAIERTHVLSERQRQLEQRERELLSLERLSGARQRATVTARVYGTAPLRASALEEFEALVTRYEELLDVAIEGRIIDVDQGASPALKEMSEKLGFLRAGPQDVVDLYVTALRKKTRITPEKADAYADEGRLLTLELMGHLLSFYRVRTMDTGVPTTTSQGARADAT